MIASYSDLQTSIGDWLVKTSPPATEFIQLFESSLRRDPRARKLQIRSFSISSDDQALPSDFHSLESWYHDGPTYYGPIQIVPADRLGEIKARLGATGVPAYAAVLDTVARFAPVPDGTYATKMLYWRMVERLSATTTTNWLLTEHPDIYLYGALTHAAPYLKDDQRLPVWESRVEKFLEELHAATQDKQFGGGSSRRHYTPIG